MSLLKPHLMQLSAYKPPLEGRDSKVNTLLDFNERTVPVIEPIKKALLDFIQDDRLQQYPAYGDVVERLSVYAGVDPEQLMITNGSDQGIDLIFRAVGVPGAEAIIPGPSFAMYAQCAKVEAMTLIEPQYTREGGYPVDEVLAAISDKTAVVVISNPNNPSGTPVAEQDIIRIAKAAPDAVILVDECYYEYTQETILPKLSDLPNVFVTRTFSKTWGIPSLRFGYLMAAPEYIKALCNIRGPYDINQLAVVAAQAALDNVDTIKTYVNDVMLKAKPELEKFLDKEGISYWPSNTNYLWTFPDKAEELNQYFIKQGFLVRPRAYGDQLGLRITVGTSTQIAQLIQVWQAWHE